MYIDVTLNDVFKSSFMLCCEVTAALSVSLSDRATFRGNANADKIINAPRFARN